MKKNKRITVLLITLLYIANFNTFLYGIDYVSSNSHINDTYEIDKSNLVKDGYKYFYKIDDKNVRITQSEYKDKNNGEYIKVNSIRNELFSKEYLKERLNKCICISILISMSLLCAYFYLLNKKRGK